MAITIETQLQTEFGTYRLCHHQFRRWFGPKVELISITSGRVDAGQWKKAPLVRIQSACLFGQTFHSMHCDCRQQLHDAMLEIKKWTGVIVFSPHSEGKGWGLAPKVAIMEEERFYRESGDYYRRTTKLRKLPDRRSYVYEIKALRDLDITKYIQLMTDDPKKRKAVLRAGYRIWDENENTFKPL